MAATTATDISNNTTTNNNDHNSNLTSMIDGGELLQGQQALAGAMSILADQISQTKLIASLVLFLITLLCGYLPVRVIVNQDYIQHAMFAGGGVLMATAFCHLIPEAHDSYKALNMHQSHHNHDHNHNQQQNNHSQQQPHDHDHLTQANASQQLTLLPSLHNQKQVLVAAATTISNDLETLISDESTTSGPGDGSFMAKINGLNVPYLEITLCCGFFFMYLVEQLMLRFINNHTHEHPCDTGSGQLIIGANTQGQHNAGSGAASNNLGAHGDSNFIGGLGGAGTGASSAAGSTSVGNLSTTIIAPSHHGSGGATELYKFIRGLLIVSAFGMHSIFDGVAIGSQDSVERVWTIFIAISCHKLIIAAVVGLELFAATLESHLWTLVHLTIFSIMSPIGIILVVVAQNSFNLNSDHPAMILLQSFATGTLLYIIFVEILQPKEDQYHTKNRLGQSFSLIAGFALMLTVLTLIDH